MLPTGESWSPRPNPAPPSATARTRGGMVGSMSKSSLAVMARTTISPRRAPIVIPPMVEATAPVCILRSWLFGAEPVSGADLIVDLESMLGIPNLLPLVVVVGGVMSGPVPMVASACWIASSAWRTTSSTSERRSVVASTSPSASALASASTSISSPTSLSSVTVCPSTTTASTTTAASASSTASAFTTTSSVPPSASFPSSPASGGTPLSASSSLASDHRQPSPVESASPSAPDGTFFSPRSSPPSSGSGALCAQSGTIDRPSVVTTGYDPVFRWRCAGSRCATGTKPRTKGMIVPTPVVPRQASSTAARDGIIVEVVAEACGVCLACT